jgi:hypothetical protein
MLPKIKFGNVILCENAIEAVRKKYVLVNVYSGNVIIDSYPAKLSLGLYAEHVPDGDTPLTIELELVANSELVAKISVYVEGQKKGIVGVILIPQFDLSLLKDTTFQVFAVSNGHRKTKILEKLLFQGDTNV